MKVNGIEFEVNARKCDYREYDDGKRTHVKELWVDEWIDLYGKCEYAAHKLTLTNRGAVTFDDKPVKEKSEQELIQNIFKGLDFS